MTNAEYDAIFKYIHTSTRVMIPGTKISTTTLMCEGLAALDERANRAEREEAARERAIKAMRSS